VWTSGCSSWYQQADGKNTALWPYTTIKFWFDTRKAKPEEYVFGIASEKLGTSKKKAALPA
jgi:cyclohexanone monooxygenase